MDHLTPRIFVGSDIWQLKHNGELLYDAAVAAVIEATPSCPVPEITFMRGDPDAPDGDPWKIARDYSPGVWAIGCDPGEVYSKTGRPGCWATPFTMFRWAIPEICGFEGYAIYTDCDQWWTKPPHQLLQLGIESGSPIYLSQGKACVMVLDCSAFGPIPWWPSIEEMRQGKTTMYDLRARLNKKGMIDASMPRLWNEPDSYRPGQTGICHTTNARTQPHHPYRHVFGRPKHPHVGVRNLYRELCDYAGIPEDER